MSILRFAVSVFAILLTVFFLIFERNLTIKEEKELYHWVNRYDLYVKPNVTKRDERRIYALLKVKNNVELEKIGDYEIVCSITTTPERLKYVGITVLFLLQNPWISKIHINLPNSDTKEILFIQNMSNKIIIGSDINLDNPNTLVIILKDYIVYSRKAIDELIYNSIKYPNQIIVSDKEKMAIAVNKKDDDTNIKSLNISKRNFVVLDYHK